MFTKLFAAVLGLFLALGLASSASAYPVTPPVASVEDSTVAPGGSTVFRAGGFAPNSTVTITVTRVDGEAAGSLDVVASGGSRAGAGFVVVRAAAPVTSFTTTADGAGFISVPVELGAAGTYTITAAGVDSDGNPVSVSSTVAVSAASGAGSGSGSDSAGAGTSGSSASGSTGATLARTGVDNAATIAWAAFGVLVLGGLLVTVASGRGRTSETV